jgi:hypothetical protein
MTCLQPNFATNRSESGEEKRTKQARFSDGGWLAGGTNCAKSFVTRAGFELKEKQVVAPKVTVTVPADGQWHEYADQK